MLHRCRLVALSLLGLPTLLAFNACATQSFDAKLLAANRGVTAVYAGADAALNAHLITKAEAQTVSTIAHQVDPLLDAAKAANDANDPANANKTMNLVNALLAGLKVYAPPPPTSP